MKTLKFAITRASSPWKTGQSKAPCTATRLAMQCTGVSWNINGVITPASVSTSIFAYMNTDAGYIFNHVCSSTDLLEIPEEEGEDWVRKDSFDMLFPAIELAEEAEAKLESDIRYLAREIGSYTDLTGTRNREITS